MRAETSTRISTKRRIRAYTSNLKRLTAVQPVTSRSESGTVERREKQTREKERKGKKKARGFAVNRIPARTSSHLQPVIRSAEAPVITALCVEATPVTSHSFPLLIPIPASQPASQPELRRAIPSPGGAPAPGVGTASACGFSLRGRGDGGGFRRHRCWGNGG